MKPLPLLIITACLGTAWSVRLTILHTNDIHARFEQVNQYGGRCPEDDGRAGKCYGGAARLQTKLNEIRANGSNILVLNAGDYYQGTLYFNLFNASITSDFVNRVGYDAMCLGNHEFDLKVKGLVPFLKDVNVPVLACNMDASAEPTMKGLYGCIMNKTLETGETVGIVGYIIPETTTLSNPGQGISFTDEVPALRSAVKQLKELGVNIIIGLGHSGVTRDQEIAEAVDGIDIIVGGHSHTFLYTGVPPSKDKVQGPYPIVVTRKDGSQAIVVQASAYGLYLGNLTVDFDEEGKLTHWEGNPIYLDNNTREDPEILAALEPYKKTVEEYGGKVVGKTDVLLRGENTYCRMQECNLGNFLVDAVVSYYRTVKTGYKENPVRLAVWNGGGIRAAIDEQINKGDVTVSDILTVAPFSNTMAVVELKGSDLKKVMEQSVSKYDVTGLSPPGGFLQISGMRVQYDLGNPSGSRVVHLEALCAKCRVPKYVEVNDEYSYLIAIPSYMVLGGDGYKIINETALSIQETGDVDVDIILAYVKRTSPIFVAVEDRIQFVEDNAGGGSTKALSTLLLVILNVCAAFKAMF